MDSDPDFIAAQGAIEFLTSVPNPTTDPVQVTLLKTPVLDSILLGKHKGRRLPSSWAGFPSNKTLKANLIAAVPVNQTKVHGP